MVKALVCTQDWLHTSRSPIIIEESLIALEEFEEVVLSSMKRDTEIEEITEGNYSIILAEKQTRRPDPTDGFRTYTGGWDITNQHYYASVAYTAFPFMAMAIIWFVVVGMFLICACICCCFCQRKKPFGYSRYVYAFSLVCLILFTITAIAGSYVMFTGEKRFLESVKKFTSYLVNKAVSIWDNLVRIQNLLISAKEVLNKDYVPDELKENIDKAKQMIHSIGRLPQIRAEDITTEIKEFFKNANTALVDIPSIMLVLAFLGLVFSILGMKTCVYIFVVLGWIIISLTFILCGMFLVFHSIVSDTCVAMGEWVEDPTVNSALEQILPCANKEAGEEIKQAGKAVTTSINDLLNQDINFSNEKTDHYNQSGPLVPLVCDPYKHQNSQQNCGDLVPLKKAQEEWKKYVCEVSKKGFCITQGRLTPDMYEEMSKAVNISYGLYESSYFLPTVVDCTVVEDTLRNITQDHCPNLKKYSAWVYGGLVGATISLMFSLFFSLLYSRERRHRKYTEKINKGYDESPLVGGKKL
ncbi:uncharacterized protein LOC120193166 [Hibiscus syriacus]|uniref:uncharacterized protein LOC120193166 n=1 Tax=Hibiscus syriacus TaxID=106335 RepID=UPI0019216146|nr:uncharacterized protein LOC120193166 [Hibiscus syriacus]